MCVPVLVRRDGSSGQTVRQGLPEKVTCASSEAGDRGGRGLGEEHPRRREQVQRPQAKASLPPCVVMQWSLSVTTEVMAEECHLLTFKILAPKVAMLLSTTVRYSGFCSYLARAVPGVLSNVSLVKERGLDQVTRVITTHEAPQNALLYR